MSRFKSFFSRGDDFRSGPISGNDDIDPYRAEDVIHIKHGANEYLFKYPVNTIRNHALNVGHVRDKCSEITGVPQSRLQLICKGHKLKDNAATLKTIGIEHNGTILAMGNPAGPIRPPQEQTSSPRHEQQPVKKKATPLEIIEGVKEEFRATLKPKAVDFITRPPPTKEVASDMHTRLGETIMGQCLLKLDGVETEDPEIRAKRKELVKEVQGILDELDRVLREAY